MPSRNRRPGRHAARAFFDRPPRVGGRRTAIDLREWGSKAGELKLVRDGTYHRRVRSSRVFLALLVALTSVLWSVPVPASAADETASLQALFDELKPGDSVTLEPRLYQHSGVVAVKVPNVTVIGNGATLAATNDQTSSFQILADGVAVSGLNLTAPLQGPRYSANEQHKLLVHADDVTLHDITINGSASGGVFIYDSHRFHLDGITVLHTRADGVHMTDGSSDGEVSNVYTEGTGDDGVAVVSYSPQFKPEFDGRCRNIVIRNVVVNGTTWGRGVSVVGGENVRYENVNVTGTSGAGIYVSSEGDPFFTQGTKNVMISGGSVTAAGWTPLLAMGAIAVYGAHAGVSTSSVTIADIAVRDTQPGAERDIRVSVQDGGAVDNVILRNISVQQSSDLPALWTNTPDSASLENVTLNGAPVTN